MCRKLFVACLVLTLAAPIFPAAAWAMKFPRPEAELMADADVVVVGRITGIEIREERSRMNSGFGNYDWAIYCSVRVGETEKGDAIEEGREIVVRCQRARFIKSFDCFACGYHYPIPEIDQAVRAYLNQLGDEYSALDPNGFMPAGSDPLVVSAAVRRLPRGRYTYLLPIGLWVAATIPAMIIWGIAAGVRLTMLCRREVRESMKRRRYRFGTVWILAIVVFVSGPISGGRSDRGCHGSENRDTLMKASTRDT
jgi:hypothetical protein